MRGLLRSQVGGRVVEGGIELVRNKLDSRSSLVHNGRHVPVPNSIIAVDERRAEPFVKSTWSLDENWSLEVGARLEYSELLLSGDSNLKKTFLFPKPRVLVTWSAGPDQLRALAERDIGQLQFADFATAATLSSETVTAGNADLEPDRTWRVELAWERRILSAGAVTVQVRHEQIDALIDRMPVVADTVFDSIGNIGEGERNELECNLGLTLDSLGMPTSVLKMSALWRHSRTTDPVTKQSRPISEDEPFEATIQFQQGLPQWNARWGVDLELPEREQYFYVNESRTLELGTTLDVFVEYVPAPAWNIRLFVNDVFDRDSKLERRVYTGTRNDQMLDYTSARTLANGPSIGLSIRRAFGDAAP